MSVDCITPFSYKTKRRHRRLADKVMKRADVKARDVALIQRYGNKWLVTVYLQDADGDRFLIPERVICSRTIEVPA